jgi:hypothetical protein
VCHSSLCLLASGLFSKNRLSSPVMGQIKNIWYTLRSLKQFCRHFVSTLLLIVIRVFWNHLFTQFSHDQILCSNLLDRTFINSAFIDDYSNRQTWIMKNERPATVDNCACSHRGRAFRSRFIFHRSSPITEYLCRRNIRTRARDNHYQTLSESFRYISAAPLPARHKS